MDEKILDEVAGKIDLEMDFSEDDELFFRDERYKTLSFSKNNYREINFAETVEKIAFIDGGNTELIKTPSFSLQLIRVAAVVYQNNKRIKKITRDFFSTSKIKNEIYETELINSEKKFSFDLDDETLKRGIDTAPISETGNFIRRFLELELAKEILNDLNSGDLIVLDGTLQTSVQNESKYLEDLYNSAREKNVAVSGFAKTSNLSTKKGKPYSTLLNFFSPEESWYYYPSVDISHPDHKADIYFTKLHKKSGYIFRLEIYKGQEYDIKKILYSLKNNSSDAVFLGYPYGLIDADKIARVSNEEKEYYRMILIAKSKYKEILQKHLNSLNAHDVLDNIF